MGTCHCLPYYVHLVHTRVPRIVIADDREYILCGGDPPRGLSDETTSLGAMATATESQLQPFKFSSTWTTSARRMTFSRAARVWSHGENCKDLTTLQPHLQQHRQNDPKGRLQAIQQHLPKALDFIVVRFFRWPCYQIQADTPVDVWSNHACQVALFFPSISTACSSRSVRSSPASELLAQVGGSVNTRSSPASRKCTPRQPREHQQAASCPRSAKAASVSVVLLSLDSGQGMHPNSLDKVRVRAVGPSWSQRATSNVPGNRGGLKKSKDKGKRSKQRRIAKRT